MSPVHRGENLLAQRCADSTHARGTSGGRLAGQAASPRPRVRANGRRLPSSHLHHQQSFAPSAGRISATSDKPTRKHYDWKVRPEVRPASSDDSLTWNTPREGCSSIPEMTSCSPRRHALVQIGTMWNLARPRINGADFRFGNPLAS